ncbi:hypothetical protein D910_06775 [Dendroctonus ponderosae]|uniref:endo-polygalacturonase n=3 Tax=Dendroctonus ponderosae TaxID=77166 RepID=U4U8P9_DENPD|nr:hypothetical protein D910_06775 [Dendroctonus ponderosae]KAH1027812.1 hypothetical protein HUJ05_001250 [Dendroctonus ponderosae]
MTPLYFVLSVLFLLQASIKDAKSDEACHVTQFYQVDVAVEICDVIVLENLFVPGGETLNLLLKDNTTVYFSGNITFGYYEWEGPLIAINATNAVIEGKDDSILNGQGELHWDGLGEWGSVKPKFFVMQLHNSIMSNIHVLNPPVHTVLLTDSTNVELSGWNIDASEGDVDAVGSDRAGHNTDGFDVFNSSNILLQDSIVHNQDDCVAIRCGTNIVVDKFICYGGHGLSISVGFSNDSFVLNTLINVTISNSIVKGGDNGIHIKTHVDGGDGIISNVTYENIILDGALKYGVNVQQNYRNQPANSGSTLDPENNIPILNLDLINVDGNVADSATPVYILCADEGCYDWKFEDVSIIGSKESNCNYEPSDYYC